MIKSLVDWEPYRPFTVGFDSLWDRLQTLELDVPNYPPYNIVKTGDNKYDVEVALAGFNKKDINVSVENGMLTIESKVKSVVNDSVGADAKKDEEMIHKGISKRYFKRSFTIADDVEVKGAELKDGLLKVSLEKIIPESKKLKTITIK